MALSVIRSLGRQRIPVNAVFGKSQLFMQYQPIVKASKYISEFTLFDENDYQNNLINCLLSIGRNLNKRGVLFPVSDEDMIILSQNRNKLEEYYHLLLPEHNLLETLLYKNQFYTFAHKNGLPIPATLILDNTTAIDDISGKFSFPCIIKPPVRGEKWRSIFKNQKALIISDAKEFPSLFKKAASASNNLICQEIIRGPETNIICTFTYLDKNSEPLSMFVCRKIRQFPPNFGNTSFADSVCDEKAVHLTKSIAKQLRLVGYLSIEFKKDSHDESYKIIEITPCRPNRQSGFSEAVGINIPFIWYCYLLNKPVPPLSGYPLKCKWSSELNELRSFSYYCKDKRNGFRKWLESYRNICQFEILARDDLKPSLMLLDAFQIFRNKKC